MSSELIIKLNEINYDTWSLVMKALLVCKDLWDIVNGSEPCPTSNTNPKAIQAYDKKVEQAHTEIILNIKPDQHSHIQEGGSSEIWESLCKVHIAWELALQVSKHQHLLTNKIQQPGNAAMDHHC